MVFQPRVVHRLKGALASRGDAPRAVTISALGDIIADNAVIEGLDIGLFAFGGGLIGETDR